MLIACADTSDNAATPTTLSRPATSAPNPPAPPPAVDVVTGLRTTPFIERAHQMGLQTIDAYARELSGPSIAAGGAS